MQKTEETSKKGNSNSHNSSECEKSPHSSHSLDSSNSPHAKTEKREIFVKNLSYQTTNDEFQAFFEKFGSVSHANILYKEGRSRGIGFIEFSNIKDAEKLLHEMPELELGGRKLGIRWAEARKEFNRPPIREKTRTVFVGNLSYRATERAIEEFFEDCGKVAAVRIAKMPDGKSKGFCHIDFETEEEAEKALERNGEEFEGRNIRVDKTLPRGSGERFGFGRGREGFHRNNRDRSRNRNRSRSKSKNRSRSRSKSRSRSRSRSRDSF